MTTDFRRVYATVLDNWLGLGSREVLNGRFEPVAEYSATLIVYLLMTSNDFARLMDAHGPPLMLYARQWCATPEDVVQDAFLKLLALRHHAARCRLSRVDRLFELC
jgi:hypothetical protein